MTCTGIIAMSGKPYHAGHDALVRLAAKECDVVHLYVSVSDRARPGEFTVSGADMASLWKATIEPSLPDNVEVTYGGSPVGNVWKELGQANEQGTPGDFVLYGDPDDLAQNFPDNRLEKYCGSLFIEGRIILRAVERSSTVDVSGTQMRDWLAIGDKSSFMEHLPNTIDRELVWNTLSKSKRVAGSKVKKPATQSEALLRCYVRSVLGRE